MTLRLVTDNTRPAPPPPRPPVLNARITGLAFHGRPVLGAMTMEVRRGETLVLTGPTGVGKTTLLRVLAGLENRHEGEVKTHGTVAMVVQNDALMPWKTLRDNVLIATEADEDFVESILYRLALTDVADKLPGDATACERRRTGLARALAVQPDLLLLDGAFDLPNRTEAEALTKLFEDIRKEWDFATVLASSNEAEAQRLATRILRMIGTPVQDAAVRQA